MRLLWRSCSNVCWCCHLSCAATIKPGVPKRVVVTHSPTPATCFAAPHSKATWAFCLLSGPPLTSWPQLANLRHHYTLATWLPAYDSQQLPRQRAPSPADARERTQLPVYTHRLCLHAPRLARRYPLATSGAFGGAHSWVVPIRNCPLDHYIEVHCSLHVLPALRQPQPYGTSRLRLWHFSQVSQLDPLNTVREYSFLSNPRVSPAFKASVAVTSLETSDGTAELKRLQDEFKNSKVLTIHNLGTVDVFSGVLLKEKKDLRRHLRVHGSWCCAPTVEEKRGLPKSAHFSFEEGL